MFPKDSQSQETFAQGQRVWLDGQPGTIRANYESEARATVAFDDGPVHYRAPHKRIKLTAPANRVVVSEH